MTQQQHSINCTHYRALYRERNGMAGKRVCICRKDQP